MNRSSSKNKVFKDSSHLQNICSSHWKIMRIITPQQVIDANTRNLICKRMLGHFQKIWRYKRISESLEWKKG